MTVVKFKKLTETAEIPKYQTAGASGMDLHADLVPHESKIVLRGGRLKVSTGIAVEIPEGYEGQIRPRSGLAHKAGVACVLGTIDSDYRGEIGVNLFNLSFHDYTVKHGERIAQLVIVPVVKAEIVEVKEFSETERGTNGFGSTGSM